MLKNNRKLLNLINYNNIISKRYFFSLFNNEKLKEDLKFPFIRRKELEFMTNEFVDCEYLINNIERYEGQELDIFEKIITSACHAAQEYTYNLREVFISYLYYYYYYLYLYLLFSSLFIIIFIIIILDINITI